MDQRQRAVEPLQEPAEGPRPEQEDRYEKAQQDLAERPLEEPAEGDREDTGG